MHPETKKINTKKHALSNTDIKSKATTKPWFSRLLRHPARKRSGSILGHTDRMAMRQRPKSTEDGEI